MMFLKFFLTLWTLIVSLFALVFVLFPSVLVAIWFPLKTRLKIVAPAWRFLGKAVLNVGCLAQIKYVDRRSLTKNDENPPFGVYVANHQSYIDIPLIASRIQIPPIMKKEVLYIPLVGLFGYASGALAVSRTNQKSRRKIIEQVIRRLVKQNFPVQYYPEGTRSKDGKPKDFCDIKTPVLSVAYRNNIPVYPISIYGTRGVLNRIGIVSFGRKVGMIQHEKVLPSNFQNEKDFLNHVWNTVVLGHSELKAMCGRN